jgi:hypothetical protein
MFFGDDYIHKKPEGHILGRISCSWCIEDYKTMGEKAWLRAEKADRKA